MKKLPKRPKTDKPLCVIASGSKRGTRRVTGWVVLCPVHQTIKEIVFPNKKLARAAQYHHVMNQHPGGDVLVG